MVNSDNYYDPASIRPLVDGNGPALIGFTRDTLLHGGNIPPDDARTLKAAGVAAVYTPKDYELNRIMADVVRIVDDANPAA